MRPSLKRFNPNSGRAQVKKASLYDFQTYVAAGQSSLNFFAIPIGQSSKTKADTNMTLASTLPKPQTFKIETIEIFFYPGVVVDIVASTATNVKGFADDVYAFHKSGSLELTVMNQVELLEAPLGRFPPSSSMRVDETISFVGAAPLMMKSSYGTMVGLQYRLNPEITIFAGQNFGVAMVWPSLVTVTADARVGVVLGGKMYLN